MDDTNTTPDDIAPPTEQTPAPQIRKPRGFATMDPEKRREIASRGGKSAHVAGTAHKFSSEEARAAGKKGGNAPHVSRGTQKRTPALMRHM